MLDERARALLDYVDPNDLTLMYDTQDHRVAVRHPINLTLELACTGPEINFSDKELAAGTSSPTGNLPGFRNPAIFG